MSSAGTRLAPSADPPKQSALARLFHALNQPLTGLQCSLELALAVPKPGEQHTRTLREGLALTARMRVLVEALRELVYSSETRGAISDFCLDHELAECVEQLRPVAAAKAVEFEVSSRDVLSVRADRNRVAAVLLRTITAAVSLCQEAGKLEIGAAVAGNAAVVKISWRPAAAPEFSPFSRPELGLVIAQASWEAAGGHWAELREENRYTCALQFPLASCLPASRKQIGDAK